MADLVSWLLAQIAEDERSPEAHYEAIACACMGPLPECHCARRARLARERLAECKAKRRIIERHHYETARTKDDCNRTGCCEDGCEITYCEGCGQLVDDEECPELRLLALPYADREGYDETWRP